MASQDILLRIKGDASGAVRSFKEAAQAARQAGDEAAKAGAKVAGAGRMGRIGGRLGASWGALGGAAGIGGALAGALGAAEIGGTRWDEITGAEGRINARTADLAYATSGPDLVKKFRQAVEARASSYRESGRTPGAVKHLLQGIFGGKNPGNVAREQEALELFKDIARSDPGQAQALLANMGNGYKGVNRDKFARILSEANAGRAYAQTININVTPPAGYTGDTRTWAKDVAEQLARAQRINGGRG